MGEFGFDDGYDWWGVDVPWFWSQVAQAALMKAIWRAQVCYAAVWPDPAERPWA